MTRQVLLDTGPLVAFLRQHDAHHEWSAEQLQQIERPLLTCEAVISEACFLLKNHPEAIEKIHSFLRDSVIAIAFELTAQQDRVFSLMRRYRNVPMSFADACLVCMVENMADSHVFTLDGDFRLYRQHGRRQIPLIIP